MTKIIVTISGSCSDQIDQETLDLLREDCEEAVRDAGGHGVAVEIETYP